MQKTDLEIADQYHHEGRYSAASYHYNLHLSDNPDDAEAHRKFGKNCREVQDLQQAQEQYKICLKLAPNNYNCCYDYANLLSADHRWDEAETYYKQCLRINPFMPDCYYNYANLLSSRNRNVQALMNYYHALHLNPTDEDYCNNMGLAYFQLGLFQPAEYLHRICTYLNPNNSYYYMNHGVDLMKLDCYSEAEQQFKKSISLNPGYDECYCNYGNLLGVMKKNLEAVDMFEKCLACAEEENDNYYLYYGIALGAADVNRFQEAERALRRSLEINPNNLHSAIFYGLILLKQNFVSRAEEFLESEIAKRKERKEKSEKLLQIYSVALERGKAMEKALAVSKLCIEIEPNNPINYWRCAELLKILNHLEQAIEHCEKFLNFGVESQEFYKFYGNLLEQNGQFNEATLAYKAGFDLNPSNDDFYFLYGSLLALTGEASLAEHHFKNNRTKKIAQLDNLKCVACCEHPAMFLNNLCGHLCLCKGCIEMLENGKCPICRVNGAFIQLYPSGV